MKYIIKQYEVYEVSYCIESENALEALRKFGNIIQPVPITNPCFVELDDKSGCSIEYIEEQFPEFVGAKDLPFLDDGYLSTICDIEQA